MYNEHSQKDQKLVFQDQLSLNAGQKYCRKLQGEHSAILLSFIKLPLVITIFVLSILEWPLQTGFTVNLSGALSESQTVWIQIRTNILSVLILV